MDATAAKKDDSAKTNVADRCLKRRRQQKPEGDSAGKVGDSCEKMATERKKKNNKTKINAGLIVFDPLSTCPVHLFAPAFHAAHPLVNYVGRKGKRDAFQTHLELLERLVSQSLGPTQTDKRSPNSQEGAIFYDNFSVPGVCRLSDTPPILPNRCKILSLSGQ
jgi:hypothetical protein